MTDAVIVDAVRTPIGRHGGALARVRPDDLAAVAAARARSRARASIPPSIDDVLLGAANQSGEDNRNVARMALLLAGIPVTVPGQTVNRLCGSGLQAIASAAHAIRSGEGSCFIAGGVESMTRAPWVMLKPETAFASRRARSGRHDTRLALRESEVASGAGSSRWARRPRRSPSAATSPARTRMRSPRRASGARQPRSQRSNSTTRSCRSRARRQGRDDRRSRRASAAGYDHREAARR